MIWYQVDDMTDVRQPIYDIAKNFGVVGPETA